MKINEERNWLKFLTDTVEFWIDHFDIPALKVIKNLDTGLDFEAQVFPNVDSQIIYYIQGTYLGHGTVSLLLFHGKLYGAYALNTTRNFFETTQKLQMFYGVPYTYSLMNGLTAYYMFK